MQNTDFSTLAKTKKHQICCSLPKLVQIFFYSLAFLGCILAFPTRRDSETFWDNGTEIPSLSRDKGTTGQAKNLAKGRDGSGQPKSGTGRDGILTAWQDFELVPLSLCPGTGKEFLSLCPEMLHCPVPLETLLQTS